MTNIFFETFRAYSLFLLSFSLFIQSTEILWLIKINKFPWSSSEHFKTYLFSYKNKTLLILILQTFLTVCAWAFGNWEIFALLFILYLFQSQLLWKGSFNGGSDSYTLLSLLFMTLSLAPLSPITQKLFFNFYAIYGIYSYWKTGWIKIKKQRWREGKALLDFLNSSFYTNEKIIHKIQKFALPISWGVMLFELSAPLWVLNYSIACVGIITALLFHLMNAWFLGLNRFLWTWAPTWPAIFFLAVQ